MAHQVVSTKADIECNNGCGRADDITRKLRETVPSVKRTIPMLNNIATLMSKAKCGKKASTSHPLTIG
ncbi:hypothetical protein N7488_009906 [Penicillium malachiteum]|nr:hypothetical protein N7488_009906 [Penicillium malachiteum]